MESLPDSTAEKSVTAACPAGKRVIGAGGSIGTTDFAVQRILTGVTPNSTLTTVTATAHEDEAGYAQNWTVVAYAVCAAAPAGLQRVTRHEPARIGRVLAGERELPGRQARARHRRHDQRRRGPGADRRPADRRRALKATITGFEDTTGFDPDWNVTAYAICVTR